MKKEYQKKIDKLNDDWRKAYFEYNIECKKLLESDDPAKEIKLKVNEVQFTHYTLGINRQIEVLKKEEIMLLKVNYGRWGS